MSLVDSLPYVVHCRKVVSTEESPTNRIAHVADTSKIVLFLILRIAFVLVLVLVCRAVDVSL